MNKVYCFDLDLRNLNLCKLNVDLEWMITIAYYRGWLEKYKNCSFVQAIVNKVNNCDVIIAPIADNRMFDLIAEFVEGIITDKQCRHALAATNLGFQYVLKTNRSINNIELIKEMYVSKTEKEQCIKTRVSLTDNGMQKVRMSRIAYRGKGNYIEEVLK